tara:strand:+ start:539 stop:997 length:459 start_codon:yes stop_codon:yes gene_type:complete
MNERKLIREFLDNMQQDYSLDSVQDDHESHDHQNRALDPDNDGYVTPEDLYAHFDSNGDNQVTTQDYVDHIKFHCAHPESLEHYNKAREISIQSVPCKTSYDSCSQHLMSRPDDIEKCLRPLMDDTGSTCKESSTKALLDVLQSLINCGVLG